MIKPVIGFTFYRLLNLVFPIVILPLIAFFSDTAVLGDFFLLQTYAFWVSLIIDFGFIRTGVVEYIGSSEKKVVINEIITAQIFIFFCTSILMSFVYLCTNMSLMGYLFVIITGGIQGLIPKWLFQAKSKMFKLCLYEAMSKLICVLILLLLMSRYPSLNSIMISFIFMYIAQCTLIVIGEHDTFCSFRFSSFLSIKKRMAMSKYVFFMRLIGNGYLNSNVIILSILSTPETIAIYGTCERIVKAISSIVTSFGEAIFPYAVSSKKSSININIVFAVLFSLPPVILLLLFNKEIIYILMQKRIELSWESFIFTSPVFFAISTVMSLSGVVACGKYKTDLVLQIIILSLTLLATLFFYLIAKESYAYYAFLMSSIISCVVYFVYLKFSGKHYVKEI
ncbi:oligosaccharide flippase family protein [Pectobacterium parvum]|uniref:oligosaccharide flippase family protein n=1 Tax=Pectobacterium parvum TaxID=2778550 RepID=UPI001374C81F|nr:oligosaccharide flippase family protein [Pectobacterium parvum]